MSSQQMCVPPMSSQQMGVTPMSSQQMGVPPMSSQQMGFPPMSGHQMGVPPMSGQQMGFPPMSGQQIGFPPMAGQQIGIPQQISYPQITGSEISFPHKTGIQLTGSQIASVPDFQCASTTAERVHPIKDNVQTASSPKPKKGFQYCGLCEKSFSHLWRHFETKHATEPTVQDLKNLRIVSRKKFDEEWTKLRSEMRDEDGQLEETQVICDCGKLIRKSYLPIHMKTKCIKNMNSSSSKRRKRVQILKYSRQKSFDWHPESFKEMSSTMKQDDVYMAGAAEPVLVKFISHSLENRINMEEYGTIPSTFR